VIITRYALLRLDFWSDGLRTIIDDVCFALGTGIVAVMVLKLISAAAQWYRDDLEPEKDRDSLEPFLVVLQRSAYALLLIVWISIVLSHFGINITALSAVLVLVVVVISLGARDVISDAITGFIILIDQPFRVGDVIAIEELNKWGDVVDIGTRVTRIRTREYQYVIVPNSKIGTSQVVNYTFPDPKYRVNSEIPVAYGSDFDQVRRVVEEAVRGVEGVVPDHPVEALFLDYGHSARRVQVRWWIDNMHQEWYIMDRVNEALETAFAEAGIEMPVTTRELIVQVDPETVKDLPRSTGEPNSPGKSAGPSSLSDEAKIGNG
jgi:small-conductance mechanosensitive channel